MDHLAGLDDKEQPWLLTGRSTSAAGTLKNISVAPRDFSTAQPLWAAVPGAMDSRMFTNDIHHSSGSAGVVNLGYRLANDPRSGALYSLFQRRINAGGSQNIAGRAEGYEDGYAHGYEAGREAGHELGYKKGYDEGFQIGLGAKTPPEQPPLEPQPEPPPAKSES